MLKMCLVIISSLNVYFQTLMKFEGVAYYKSTRPDGWVECSKCGVTFENWGAWTFNSYDKDGDGVYTYNDVRFIKCAETLPFYKTKYWDFWGLDKVGNQVLAECIFDLYVNAGAGYNKRHIKAIQGFVGVDADGVVGQKTKYGIDVADSKMLVMQITAYRVAFYRTLGSKNAYFKSFERGWIRRAMYFQNKIST